MPGRAISGRDKRGGVTKQKPAPKGTARAKRKSKRSTETLREGVRAQGEANTRMVGLKKKRCTYVAGGTVTGMPSRRVGKSTQTRENRHLHYSALFHQIWT